MRDACIITDRELIWYNGDDFVITDGGELMKYKGNAKVVTIPEGVKYIHDRAFFKKGLKKVIFPQTLVSIGDEAFAYNNLRRLVFKSQVELGKEAFKDNKIKSVKGPVSYIVNSFVGNPIMHKEGMIIIGSNLVAYKGEAKKRIIIPEGVTIINFGAFYDKEIEQVTFPSTLKVVGSETFVRNKLTSIEFKSPVKIDAGAFIYNQIKEVRGPVISCSPGAFYGNPIGDQKFVVIDGTLIKYNGYGDEENVVIPEGVTVIKNQVFLNKKIKQVTFPRTLKKIETQAFKWNKLTRLEFKSPVEIDAEAFADNNIQEVIGPVISCSPSAFSGNIFMNLYFTIIDNTLLKYNGSDSTVEIPEGVKKIAKEAFAYKKLKKVIFPSSLEVIEDKAFYYNQLQELIFKSPVVIKKDAFSYNPITKISGPIKELHANTFDDKLPNIEFIDGLELIEKINADHILLPSTTKRIKGSFSKITIINPSLTLLDNIAKDKPDIKKLVIETPLYNPEIGRRVKELGSWVTYKYYNYDKYLRDNTELNELIIEIENILDNSHISKSKVIKYILSLAKDYETFINEHKPTYKEDFGMPNTSSIFSKTFELKSKLIELKKYLLTEIKKEELINEVKKVIDAINNSSNNTSISSIISYITLSDDETFKASLIKELESIIATLSQSKLNIDNEILSKTLTKYTLLAENKLNLIKPYYEVLDLLNKQIDIMKLIVANTPFKTSLEPYVIKATKLKKHLENMLSSSINNSFDLNLLKQNISKILNSFLDKYNHLKGFTNLFNETESYPIFSDSVISSNYILSINQVLAEIYTLIEIGNIDEETKNTIEKEIATIMKKWQNKMIESNFIYQESSYFHQMTIKDNYKFELEILKELYLIIFNLSSYLNNLSFYETLRMHS